MQGNKDYQEKMFTSFQLSERIPKENFYRRLKEALDLRFLKQQTKQYYGDCGQKSIDSIVFFKLCLVGYLENIISDRKLMEHCAMRMDILYFIGYDIDEPLPWHSTISRTRALFPTEVFESVFNQVFSMCVDSKMVSGHTQTIDSAPVKANASMDSLELKVPEEELDTHLRKVRYMSTPDRKAKENKASEEEQTLRASERQLKELESRTKKWSENQDERPGSKKNNARYTSNHTHYSPTDPDARISVKPGKARKLNYSCQMAVDTAHHVISHIEADFASKKDNQSLQHISQKLQARLHSEQLLWRNLVADTGYSSGENYAFLEREGLQSFIPPHGTYRGGPEGFTYHEEGNYWECPQGIKLDFKATRIKPSGIKENEYAAKQKDCKGCPIATSCKGKRPEKRMRITYYHKEYQRNIERVNSKQGKYLKRKRQSTVEPVFGTLTQFMGLRKVNTRGIANASKVMLMAGVAYNLKKYMKFTHKKVKSVAQTGQNFLFALNVLQRTIFRPIAKLKF